MHAGVYASEKYDNIMISMETMLLLLIIGFAVCFILLFYFTAKYRAALALDSTPEDGEQDLTVMTVGEPSFASRTEVLGSLQNTSALEVADLKEKVKELHYQLQEYKLAQEKNNADMAKVVSRMELRLATFEQEYVNKLQPTLLGLIEDLEHIKDAQLDEPAVTAPATNASVANVADAAVANSPASDEETE